MIRIRAFTVRVGYPYGEAVTAISGLANSADFVFIQAAFVFTDFHKFILKKILSGSFSVYRFSERGVSIKVYRS
jgi:hypothetical protein